MNSEKGESDKKLAEILNQIDEKLIDLNLDEELGEKEKISKKIKEYIYKRNQEILNSLTLPFSGSAFGEALDYLTYFNQLLMKYG